MQDGRGRGAFAEYTVCTRDRRTRTREQRLAGVLKPERMPSQSAYIFYLYKRHERSVTERGKRHDSRGHLQCNVVGSGEPLV